MSVCFLFLIKSTYWFSLILAYTQEANGLNVMEPDFLKNTLVFSVQVKIVQIAENMRGYMFRITV